MRNRITRRLVTPVVATLLAASLSAAIGLAIGATPADAILGCSAGQGALGGKVTVKSGVPRLTRVDAKWNGDLTYEKTQFASAVDPGNSQDFLYCGKSIFLWPTEVDAQYRMNGPSIANQVTGFLVKMHLKIPFKGDNEATCEIFQEFGPKLVLPYYCETKLSPTPSDTVYAIVPEFVVQQRTQQVVTNPNEQARLLHEYCSGGDTTKCEYDPAKRLTEVRGPVTQVSQGAAGECTRPLTVSENWTQTVQTTHQIGGSVGVTLGTVTGVFGVSVQANYSYAWTESKTQSSTYTYEIPIGLRQALFRSANLVTVSGKFLLGQSGPTTYVIPNAIFTFADPSGLGQITVQTVGKRDCPPS